MEQPAVNAAPARLRKGETTRSLFQQGMRISGMNPHTRLLALTLLGHANFRSGVISPQFQPSDEELVAETGLTLAQVNVQLSVLRSRGWLVQHVSRNDGATDENRWRLAVPEHVLARLRTTRR
ncbi:hypothetical protein [Streptomyces sp. NPDC005423]|uniref:hypothetical protein n=1 Tax=Streptomyces sp. NPDC005423 TaxID=3155343 RepID=UPI0033AB6D4B